MKTYRFTNIKENTINVDCVPIDSGMSFESPMTNELEKLVKFGYLKKEDCPQ